MNNMNKLVVAIAFAMYGPQMAKAEGVLDFAEEAKKLDAISVEADYIGEEQSSIKVDAVVKDVPFSLSNYTSEFMDQIDANRLGDVYQYMTGISRSGKGGYAISIRGFQTLGSDRNGVLVDGLPGVAGRSGSPPTAGVDRVEVFRGPASVLYGSASPGGFVNLITKKPQELSHKVIELRANTYAGSGFSFGKKNGYDALVDMTGPIDDERRFLYRVVGQYYDNESFRDDVSDKAMYLSPSLSWLVSDYTSLRLSYEYHDEESSYDDYLVAPNNDLGQIAPINTRYQDPDDMALETSKTWNIALEHEFSEHVKFNLNMRQVSSVEDGKYKANNAIRADQLSLQRVDRHLVNTREFRFLDASLNLSLMTGAMEHKILVGVTGGKETSDFDRRQFYNPPARPNPLSLDVDIYDPIVGIPVDVPVRQNSQRHSDIDVASIYFSDHITLTEKWKAMLGIRYDKETVDAFDKRGLTEPSAKEADQVSPMAGLVYQPNENWSFYGSYTTSFRPPSVTALDIDGVNSFDPETGNQIEVGAKLDIADGRATTTLSLYQLTRENGIVRAPAPGPFGNYQVQVGESQSNPLDWDSPTCAWSFRKLSGAGG